MNDSEITEISPSELDQRLRAGNPLVLLDVREDHERAHCRIPAPSTVIDIHVPMSRIADRAGPLLLVDGPMVIYCHHGVRSMAVAEWLASQGKQGLVNLEGGIDRWSRVVDPGVPRY